MAKTTTLTVDISWTSCSTAGPALLPSDVDHIAEQLCEQIKSALLEKGGVHLYDASVEPRQVTISYDS